MQKQISSGEMRTVWYAEANFLGGNDEGIVCKRQFLPGKWPVYGNKKPGEKKIMESMALPVNVCALLLIAFHFITLF